MPNFVIDTDVLIVSAEPGGLFLANEFARRGLRWRIIETALNAVSPFQSAGNLLLDTGDL
jgi:2-polyprenyl-6-methoxyphenol hydroxylase-like FAD-dependent oxidoreductase